MRKKEARQIKKSKKATEAAEILARARNTQKRLAKNDAMDDKADAMVDKMTSDDVPSRSILFKEKSGNTLANSTFQQFKSCHTFEANNKPHSIIGRQLFDNKSIPAVSINLSTYIKQTTLHSALN